jgi:hypothetical protein
MRQHIVLSSALGLEASYDTAVGWSWSEEVKMNVNCMWYTWYAQSCVSWPYSCHRNLDIIQNCGLINVVKMLDKNWNNCRGIPRGGGVQKTPRPEIPKFCQNWAEIRRLKVPKIKKILLYEMKFLVPNYSCLQNPWLGATAPRSPFSRTLSSTEFVEPPPQKILVEPNPHPPENIPG